MPVTSPPPTRARASSRVELTDLAGLLVLALMAGAVPFLGLSPLLLPAALVLALVGLRLLRAPDTSLKLALVAVLLPPGLLPPLVQSALDVGTVLLAAAAALLAVRPGHRSAPLPLALWLMGAFVVWGLLTLTWSAEPSTGSDLMRRYTVALVLLVLVVHRTPDRAGIDRLMSALAVVAWVVVLCGSYALVAGFGGEGGRLQVFDMNPNQVGNVLLLTSPGVLWGAVAPGRVSRAHVVQAVVFLLASLVLIAESGSRGSLLAFVLMVAAFVATRTLRVWGLIAAGIAVTLLLATPALFSTVIERVRYEDPTQLSRSTLWGAGLSLIADHPFGVGVGEGPAVMPDYINARTSLDHFRFRDTLPAHNPLIEVGTDTGVIGVALYGAALAAAAGAFLVVVGRAHRRRDPYWTAYGAVVLTGSFAFLTAWWKSGGESYSFTTFVLLSLWLAGARACAREERAKLRLGGGLRR